jgi:uncharacterized protein (TIGR03435 family)
MIKLLLNLLLIVMLSDISVRIEAQKLASKKPLEISIQRSLKIGTSGMAKGDNLIQFTNYSVSDVLLELLSGQVDIEIQNPKLKMEKLDITLKTSSVTLETGKEILIDSLLKRYSLKMKSAIKKRVVWNLSMIDKEKFNTILSDSHRKDGVLKKEEFIGKQLKLTNSTVDELAKSLSHYLNEPIENQTDTKTNQDFNLTISPRNILEVQLESIGLKLIKKKKTIKRITIS